MEANEDREFERQEALIKALRQEMNERRREGVEEARLDFLCECSNPSCRELVSSRSTSASSFGGSRIGL
jgi:hypothetical protein